MAAAAQVTWAEFGSDGAELLAIGGIRRSFFGKSQWRLSADDAVALIEHDEWSFYVEVDDEKQWLNIDKDKDGNKSLSPDGAIRTLM